MGLHDQLSDTPGGGGIKGQSRIEGVK